MSNISIPEKLLPLVEKSKRFKIIIGGRGSGKSTTIGNIMIMKCETEAADVLCLREIQNSIDDSVHKLLKKTIDQLGIDKRFYSTDKKIDCVHNGAGFRYKGAARNESAIKSAEGFKYSWFEEAQTISQNTLDLLIPTIREEGSELWFSANPKSSNDPFSKRFIVPFQKELERDGYYEDDLHLIVVMNWRDNPWFPMELQNDRLYDLEHLPRAKYDHIWEGKFDDTIEKAIIQPEWFDACIDSHKKLGIKIQGVEVVAHDPSDVGSDPKGLAYRHGILIKDVKEMINGDINEGGDWAIDFAVQNKVDVFTWDCDGMGVGLNRQVTEGLATKGIRTQMYRGSESPTPGIYETVGDKVKTNQDTFFNKRAQGYWILRDRMYKTYLAIEKGEYMNPDDLISFSSDIETLDAVRSEVCRIPTVDNGAGKIQIMSKPNMKKFGIPSPNMADSVMMAMFYNPQVKKQRPHVNVQPISNKWNK